jgi:pseudouridine synthase
MILTNDGTLTQRLTHPSFEVPKTYVVKVDGGFGPASLRQLTEGVDLDDGSAVAVSARVLDQSSQATLVEVVMTEGRNREVRRMMDAIGVPTLALTRVAIGPLVDRSLKPGAWRPLSDEEVRSLYAAGREPAS